MKYKLEGDTPERESPCSDFATPINNYLKNLKHKHCFIKAVFILQHSSFII